MKTFLSRRIACLVLLSALSLGSASAYVVLDPARTWDNPPNYTVDDRGLNGVVDDDAGATLVVNAITSIAAWNGVRTVVQANRGSVANFTLGDGIPMLNFQDPIGACTGNCLAATFTGFFEQRPNGSWRITDADIVTNSGGHNWTSQGEDPNGSGCSNEFYIEGVMVHEAGHGIGIGHSAVSGATMAPTVSACNNTPASIEQDDRNAVLCLYAGTHISGSGTTFASRRIASLGWGATPCLRTANVDVFRNGVRVTTTANDGAHTDMFSFAGTSPSANYWVCEAGSTTWYDGNTCSNVITIDF